MCSFPSSQGHTVGISTVKLLDSFVGVFLVLVGDISNSLGAARAVKFQLQANNTSNTAEKLLRRFSMKRAG